MSNVGKTMLRGHALRNEGLSIYDANGKQDWWGEGSHGLCECGQLFGPGLSQTAVKRAHRVHKDSLRSVA